MGMHEIHGLRNRFGGILGLKTFHDVLLAGGEIPIDLVQQRMTSASSPVDKEQYPIA
jgi:hypothetical protein